LDEVQTGADVSDDVLNGLGHADAFGRNGAAVGDVARTDRFVRRYPLPKSRFEPVESQGDVRPVLRSIVEVQRDALRICA
jgi:hypothetical protein